MVTIETNYAGANAKIISLQEGVVQLEQDLRDTERWWFYWNFAAVSSEESQEVAFEFMNGEVIGPWGPAVSSDGVHWEWLGAGSKIAEKGFRFVFKEAGEKKFFAFAIPYQLHHFEQFAAKLAGHPLIERSILCLSEQFRALPMLRIGNRTANRHLLFTARQHACESTTNYLLEGMLAYLLAHQSPLLQTFQIHYVPFMDIDGVENGDQGKGRAPHDHNRDYGAETIYRSTVALKQYVSRFPFEIALDFHCPFKWGERHDHVFFVKHGPEVDREVEALGLQLQLASMLSETPGAITYSQANDIGYGEDWNLPGNPTLSRYMVEQGARLACSFEFPYFGLGDMKFTVPAIKQFGARFGEALASYLK